MLTSSVIGPSREMGEPLAPHGDFGIEAKVVDAIAAWITKP